MLCYQTSSMMMTLCLADDESSDGRSEIFCSISDRIKEASLIGSIDDINIYSKFVTECFCNSGLATSCRTCSRSKLGTSPLCRKFLKVFLVLSGSIHSSIVLGRYFSTQRNSSRIIKLYPVRFTFGNTKVIIAYPGFRCNVHLVLVIDG